AGYAAAGALGSMASQGAAMAMGMQDRFSWSQVGLNAIGAGVSAGIGEGLLGPSLAKAPIGIRAAAGSALTQGVGVATGLQKSFNWTAVVASGAAAGISAWVGDGLGWNSTDPVASVGYGTLRGLVSGGIQSGAIAAESFGSALGDQVASGLQKRDQQRQDSQQALAQVWECNDNVLSLSPATVKEQARFSGREKMDVAQRATAGKAGGAEDFNWEDTIALEPVTVTAPRPGAWQRMLNAVNRGLEWAKSGVEWMLGVQEVGVTMATGLVAAPASGYGMMLTGGNVEAGRNIAAALTYQPRLGTSQTMLEGLNNTVGAGFRWMEQQAGDGGYWLGSLTGNSQLAVWGGTAGATLPTAASILLGPGSSSVRSAFGSVGRLGSSSGARGAVAGFVPDDMLASPFAMRERILDNVAATRSGNKSSSFTIHLTVEELLGERMTLGFTSNRRMQQNFAFSDFQINGDAGRIYALSGTQSPVGTVGITGERVFATKVVDWDRAFDTEVKLLETLARRYNPQGLPVMPNVSGTVRLSSELNVCYSCSGVINQFDQMFPGVKITVDSGPYPNKIRFKGK
ncbi:hypothetical protein LQT98_23220, partial [Chromobacterium aquaticum]|uniref:deaminase domain-containing protein n=1 Tax=Chromobacterium aquaticum TaxID=467180 RepID=UPI0022AEF8FD